MDFNITEDQKEICESIRLFSLAKLNNDIFKNDEEAIFPKDKWVQCAELGIHGLPFPKEYGGLGQNMLTTSFAIETFAQYCKDEGLIFSILACILTSGIPLLFYGTNDQKDKYLSGIIEGKLIGGNAITETHAGSDCSSITTKVIKKGDNYIINGTKIFVTNAPVSNLLIIYAKHSDGLALFNISAFIVEKSNPGFNIGQRFNKMGLRTSPLSEIVLNDCIVNSNDLLGRERLGMNIFNESMLWERIIMSAYHVGAMKQQFDIVEKYANERTQFGDKIIHFQNVSSKLIEMKLRIESSKLLLYNVSWKYDNKLVTLADASMLKLLSSEAKIRNSLDAVQIFGAYGYMKEYDVEKQLRDSIAATIYSGTTEIQKRIIAQSYGN